MWKITRMVDAWLDEVDNFELGVQTSKGLAKYVIRRGAGDHVSLLPDLDSPRLKLSIWSETKNAKLVKVLSQSSDVYFLDGRPTEHERSIKLNGELITKASRNLEEGITVFDCEADYSLIELVDQPELRLLVCLSRFGELAY